MTLLGHFHFLWITVFITFVFVWWHSIEKLCHSKKVPTSLCFLTEQIRQVEVQFTIGEALSCAGAGRTSQVARDPWVVEQLASTACDKTDEIMQELTEKIINKYATSPTPYVRQVCFFRSTFRLVQALGFCRWVTLIEKKKKGGGHGQFLLSLEFLNWYENSQACFSDWRKS